MSDSDKRMDRLELAMIEFLQEVVTPDRKGILGDACGRILAKLQGKQPEESAFERTLSAEGQHCPLMGLKDSNYQKWWWNKAICAVEECPTRAGLDGCDLVAIPDIRALKA